MNAQTQTMTDVKLSTNTLNMPSLKDNEDVFIEIHQSMKKMPLLFQVKHFKAILARELHSIEARKERMSDTQPLKMDT